MFGYDVSEEGETPDARVRVDGKGLLLDGKDVFFQSRVFCDAAERFEEGDVRVADEREEGDIQRGVYVWSGGGVGFRVGGGHRRCGTVRTVWMSVVFMDISRPWWSVHGSVIIHYRASHAVFTQRGRALMSVV